MKARTRLPKIYSRKILIKPAIFTALVLMFHQFSIEPDVELLSPYVSTYESIIEKKEVKPILSGEASYYSRAGCLGCEYRYGKEGYNLYMHNDDVLRDEDLTIALTPDMYRKYKNINLVVTNQYNNQKVTVKVTDSGGFARHDRVADLSVATKEAIECDDLCLVSINIK